MAAGMETVRILKETNPYPYLEQITGQLEEGLTKVCHDLKVPARVQRVGSMITLFFNAEPVWDYEDAKRSDTALFGRFFWEMLARGVYLPCSQFEAAFVSVRHTESDIHETIKVAGESLEAIFGK